MGLVHRFLAASLFIWPLDHSFHSFTPIPPHFYFSSDKSVCQVPGPICVGAHGWKVRVYQGPGVQLVECGVRMIGSDLNRTWRKRGEKNEGRVGRVLSLSIFSPLFFPRQFFDCVLPSERLEQANQGLALPKVEAPGQTRHSPPLNDAVVKER